jgi:uncharacterized lipoprotein YddW (UPF0748 family)
MKVSLIKTAFFFIITYNISGLYSQQLPEQEFRGVWITTAFNIDWPSSALLNSDEQKSEFVKLLDAHQRNGINAILVQVRPAAEVFYESDLEPWSHWLTGLQGRPPVPYYDPMKFMIEECRKRKIEFHAWINPFRAVSNIERVKVVPNHITRQKPEWFVTYGEDVRKIYFNPGIPEARSYIIQVIMEIISKYDVDGIHFDDYFYPVKEGGVEFPDNQAYQKYGTGFISRADWRRENLNHFIKTIHDSILRVKPSVKFGIGPSGVWRNKGHDREGSNTRGLASYDEQFADTRKWLREGWIDYIAPQIYWTIGFKAADYQELVDWWSRNVFGRHLYIGHASHRINTSGDWKDPSAIPDQLRLNKKYPQVKGSIFYSSSALLKNNLGFLDTLRNDFYMAIADVPEMDWKPKPNIGPTDKVVVLTDTSNRYYNQIRRLPEPMAPINFTATKVGKEVLLKWEMDKSQTKFLADTGSYYHVYRFKGKYSGYPSPEFLYKTTKKPYLMVSRKGMFKKHYSFIVAAVNSQNREGWQSNALIVKMKD